MIFLVVGAFHGEVLLLCVLELPTENPRANLGLIANDNIVQLMLTVMSFAVCGNSKR